MRASRGERVCTRFSARLDGVAHLGGEVLWNQSFGSAGEGWDGPLRATHSRRAFPRWHQPLRTRVLLEDPAHVPGTNSGFRVHVLQTWLGLGLGFRHRVEQGLVLVIGRGAGVVARAAPGSVASTSASEQLTVLRARRRWRGRCAPGRLRQPGRGAWPPGSGAMPLPKDLG